MLNLRMRNAPAALNTSVFLFFPSRPKSKPVTGVSVSASLDIINAFLGQLVHAVRNLINVVAQAVSVLPSCVTHVNSLKLPSMFFTGLVVIRRIPLPVPKMKVTTIITTSCLLILVGILLFNRLRKRSRKKRKKTITRTRKRLRRKNNVWRCSVIR
jgi:hypothetical protein